MTAASAMAGRWPHAFEELSGRRALVTGGSTGIGAAVARGLASCGVNVALHYNASPGPAEAVCDDIRKHGVRADAIRADLSRPDGAQGLVDEVIARFGGLDLVINNAGSIMGRIPTLELSRDTYSAIMDLNLNAVFHICQTAIAHFVKEGTRGTIINTTSLAARNGGGPGTVGYAAAKAGVSTLTRGLAKEFAPHGIRVNAVAPGFIATPLHDRHTPAGTMEAFEKSIPMARIGVPEDCVGTYLFLACESLSGYVTGQTIEVNGGIMMP